ncbi:unnamed protein product [Cercopithifilaria johnstoni]|uniref:SEA domain-containing protein n=1 Tax=Cercopithifilaria johnstoni TaxID=2874296 RepID=A0A8J2Q1B5_9BILA|nr:unnamed protein product [Cercopithifilaria johnstoni]
MRSEILIHLLALLLSAIAQNIEPENNTMEAVSSSSPSPLSSQTVQIISNSESEAVPLSPERSFPIEKLAETIAPRERGFPLPEIQRAVEVDDSKFKVPEQKSLSTTLPFITEIDRGATTIEAQSDDLKYQNATQQERRNNDETSISSLTKIPKLSLSTISEADVITKMSEHIEDEDELPPEVRAEDPFAATNNGQSIISNSSISQQNIPHVIQNNSNSKMNLLAASGFLNNSGSVSNEAMKVDQSSTLDKDFNTDTTDMTFNRTSASLKPEQETPISQMTSETTMALGIQKISQAAISEKQSKNTTSYITATFETSIMETTPDIISQTTASNIITSVEQTTGIPVLHPITSQIFSIGNDEQSTMARQIVMDGITTVDMSQESEKHHTSPVVEMVPTESFTHSSFSQPSADDAFVTESLATVSSEIEHQWEITKIPTISIKLPQTVTKTATTTTTTTTTTTMTINEFSTDNENEHGEDDDDDESLFVGDKTLFNQDNIFKPDLSSTHSITEFTSPTETSEENFGVPGFSRIERLGPEATEEIRQVRIDATTHNTLSNIESKMQTDVSIDLPANFNEHHNDERTSVEKSRTVTNFLEEGDDLKDISVVVDSFYHTDIEGIASTFRPTTIGERILEPKLMPKPEPIPEVVLLPENGVFENSESKSDFKPKPEPQFTVIPEDSNESKNDLNGILHIDRTHITAKEGAYKVPFSFRITNIDYIPEFGDPNSGKYKKLQDQLLPDLEEIFGSIFGHIYSGIHLVNFLKGSVIVDGIVYTSTKPDDMEQSATEFEQQITAKDLQIGGNDVDPRSIVLDGFISKNYVERVHEGYTSDNTSSYIIGGCIAIGILTILLIAFIVIATNNRRTNGTLKLKEESIAMADNNRSMWQNGTSPVNLMGYGNGRMIQGGITANTQPPMVLVGSQMTAVNMHESTRAIQPHP